MKQQRWQDWVMLVLGVWFFLSPLMFGYNASASAANAYIFGAVVIVMALWALARPRRWEEWVTLAVGLWLIISPFVLGFRTDGIATTNHVVIGLLIAIDALSALMDFPPRRLVSR